MPTLGPYKLVRAVKEHKCDLCGLRIRRRATYLLREGVEGREHWRMRMHPVCEAQTHRWDATDWECSTDEIDFRWHELYLRPLTLPNIVAELFGGPKHET